MSRVAIALTLAIASIAVASNARAEECPKVRPTDPGGYLGYAYDREAVSFASTGGNARVWYTTAGPHAPPAKSTRPDGVPDAVAITADVLENAITGYAKMGFKPALRDGTYPACASNGGDGRVDVYLFDFKGADGLTAQERCTGSPKVTCPGFLIVDHDFAARGYKSFEEGARTVVAHEYFHLVQNAYDANVDRWWAEGSAQWATQQLYPELRDLERFLPDYVNDAERPIDAPPTGVAAGFLYGTAVWPVFLAERHGAAIIPDIFAALPGKVPLLDAIAPVLEAKSTTVQDEFRLFGAWNVATGARSGEGGYAARARYQVKPKLRPLQDGFIREEGITAGWSIRYYEAHDPSPRELSLESDDTRLGGMVVPLEEGKARIDKAIALPARLQGDAIVVLAGRSAKKTDVPYALVTQATVDPTPDAGPAPQPPGGDTQASKGCSVARVPAPLDGRLALFVPLLFMLRRRRTRS